MSSLDSVKLKERYLSLDVFRGATICLMIIVNSPGKGAEMYPFLVHAPWFGFTLADLVFPSFLFAVGNAMSFSLKRFKGGNDSKLLKKIVKRTILIFLIGYLMYWFPFFQQTESGEWILKPMADTRIMGVLQRIALCYFFATLIVRYLSKNMSIIVSGFLLLSYWAVLYLFGDYGREFTIEGNVVVKLDILLFGESHVYNKDVVVFDPEGLLSTIPAIVNVIAGYWTGVFIQKKEDIYKKLAQLMIFGLALITVALGWDLVFPISKKLWTSSFVLYTTGLDVMILSFLIYFIEIKNWKFGINFFDVFGKNPLFIYLLSELLLITLSVIRLGSGESIYGWISLHIFQKIFPGSIGVLVTAVWFMGICWLAGYWLDKRKIYVKI